MSAKRAKILKIAVAAVVFIAAAAICVFLSLAFVLNNEASLCAYLNEHGVTASQLSLLLDDAEKVSQTFDGDKTEFDDGADALYSLICAFAENGELVLGAADAYYDAPAAADPFALFKYSSLREKLTSLFSDTDGGLLTDGGLSAISSDHMTASLAQIMNICEKIAANGKDAFDETAQTVYEVRSADDVLGQVALKSILNAYDYAVTVTGETDFSELYLMDLAFGEGYCAEYGSGVNSAAAVLRSADRETVLDLFMYLPDRAHFAVAVCRYAAEQTGFDKADFANALAAAVSALAPDSPSVEPEDALAAFDALAAIDPDNMSEADSENAARAAEYFESVFSPLASLFRSR